jgi:hypothetical protein
MEDRERLLALSVVGHHLIGRHHRGLGDDADRQAVRDAASASGRRGLHHRRGKDKKGLLLGCETVVGD